MASKQTAQKIPDPELVQTVDDAVETGTELVVRGNTLPDYIKDSGKSQGHENVTVDDMVVPRIEIVQGLSPCLDPGDTAAYIQGAQIGMLFNTLTRKLYGKSLIVVPVQYTKQWLVWRNRKLSSKGGFRGGYATELEAKRFIQSMPAEDKPEEWEAIETGQHLVLIANATGRIEEAMVSMARTKMKVSRQWNSLARQAGGDRFSRAYELTTTQAQNDKGDKYQNFTVRPVGFPNQTMYEAASKFYAQVSTGVVNVVMDTSDVDLDGDEPPARRGPTEF